MPKRVHSISDRDDDSESINNQSASKRTRKAIEDREIVSDSLFERLIFLHIYFIRVIFVKNYMMLCVHINRMIVESFVKVLFVYQAKGSFVFFH